MPLIIVLLIIIVVAIIIAGVIIIGGLIICGGLIGLAGVLAWRIGAFVGNHLSQLFSLYFLEEKRIEIEDTRQSLGLETNPKY